MTQNTNSPEIQEIFHRLHTERGIYQETCQACNEAWALVQAEAAQAFRSSLEEETLDPQGRPITDPAIAAEIRLNRRMEGRDLRTGALERTAEIESCEDCGHAVDLHDRRAEDSSCEVCEDLAQGGELAPCISISSMIRGFRQAAAEGRVTFQQ